MQLVITEKPQVARDIARVLGASTKKPAYFEGDGIRITWCYGHMCELQMPEHYNSDWKRWRMELLPMVPDTFKLQIKKDVKEHWSQVQKLLKDKTITEVVNACDAGREGELIFRYVYQYAKCHKPIKRLWISSLEDAAIIKGWSSLRDGADFDNLAAAARSRSEADWLVGLNATRAMTCLAQSAGGDQLLSVGRVQTPTLALIVDRDEIIKNFDSETFWKVQATFKIPDDEQTWKSIYYQPNISEEKSQNETNKVPKAERLETKQLADTIAALAKNNTGVVGVASKKRTTEKTPLLYDLNSLQQRANKRYGFTAQQTLDIAQSLYETHKLLTYPRTDSRYLTPDMQTTIPEVFSVLEKIGPYTASVQDINSRPLRTDTRIFNSKEVGDHHAIIPTKKNPLRCNLRVEEKQLFDLVVRRTLAGFSEDALFDQSQIIVDIALDNHDLPEGIQSPLKFRAKGKVCVRLGWQVIDPPSKHKDSLLPQITEGVTTNTVETMVNEGKTRPPHHYSEASLLGAMEKAGRNLNDVELKRAMKGAGLGTPATRAGIIENLIRRRFIVRKKKNLLATDRGINLVNSIPVEELKSALLTGRWEARLSSISDGSDSRESFMNDVVSNLVDLVEQIRTSPPPQPEIIVNKDSKKLGDCPTCGAPVRKQNTIFRCDLGRRCSFRIYGKIATRNISSTMIKELLSVGRTKTVKGFKSKRTGKEFSAALRFNEDSKVVFDFSNSSPQSNATDTQQPNYPIGLTCPKCTNGTLIKGRAAWGCNQYREGCRFVFAFIQDGIQISDKEATRLIRQM